MFHETRDTHHLLGQDLTLVDRNKRRLQNMILAVGPTTPASLCWSDDDEGEEEDDVLFMGDSSTSEEEDSDDEHRVIRRDDLALSSDESQEEDPPRRPVHHAQRPRHQARTITHIRPSIRHSGCINTACWLTSPWKFSLHDGVQPSTHVTTQVLTSGDDQYVKVWDLSQSMGSNSPVAGGWDTMTPFADNGESYEVNEDARNGAKQTFRARFGYRHARDRPGSVSILASVSTGHHGNVFHVNPIDEKPGKVLTCAADGYLRLVDLEISNSTVVFEPLEDDLSGLRHMIHAGMAYSHEMLSSETGLLCSEYGLHRFDLRVPPRDQQRRSLLESVKDTESTSDMCKCCAVWYPNGKSDTAESTYVFAGGASSLFGLYDLRMDGHGTKTVQQYHPSHMDPNYKVSTSGLEISRDGREVLASYESDQIYTYPILPGAAFSRGPLTGEDVEKVTQNDMSFQMDMCLYGGHLNRFTFLKVAKYAGPNDKYICTGSDSGHAWIFERETGGVAALLGADSSACNGVAPHPDLPFFVTYGIQSTAKLWRATLPVDRREDDSTEGRIRTHEKQPMELSPPTEQWLGVQALVSRYSHTETVYPDYIASSAEMGECGRCTPGHRRGICGEDSPIVGNALTRLPSILRSNRFEAYRGDYTGTNLPVRLDLQRFSSRIGNTRMQHQADRLGLRWHLGRPFELKGSQTGLVHPSDLVPDFPSDWIPEHRTMSNNAHRPHVFFVSDTSDLDVIRERYRDFHVDLDNNSLQVPWLSKEKQSISKEECVNSFWPTVAIESETNEPVKHDEAHQAQKILYETVLLCKEGGNAALKDGQFDLAARRYDKAIEYCAALYMGDGSSATGELDHLTRGHVHVIDRDVDGWGGPQYRRVIVNWSPLLYVMITTRLNLSLLLMKPSFLKAHASLKQARIAISLLEPFAREEGKVKASKDERTLVLRRNVPTEVYHEACILMIKAYFRLGTAQLHLNNVSEAVGSLERAVAFAERTGTKPDQLLRRRLQEAKIKLKLKRKRTRTKFERMVASEDASENDGEPSDDETAPTLALPLSGNT